MEKKVNKRKGVLKAAVPTGTALAVAHSLAVVNDWYRSVPWIDMPIHFWWAIAIGLVIYWVIERFPGHVDLGKNLFVTILIGLSLSAFLGILWEFGEFAYDYINISRGSGAAPVQFGVGDTLADLLFDILGGLTVAIFVWLRYHKKRKKS